MSYLKSKRSAGRAYELRLIIKRNHALASLLFFRFYTKASMSFLCLSSIITPLVLLDFSSNSTSIISWLMILPLMLNRPSNVVLQHRRRPALPTQARKSNNPLQFLQPPQCLSRLRLNIVEFHSLPPATAFYFPPPPFHLLSTRNGLTSVCYDYGGKIFFPLCVGILDWVVPSEREFPTMRRICERWNQR